MATITVTKGQIGVEDISFMSGGATTGETFSRATSIGGSQTIHKVTAKAIPVEDSSSLMTGTNVEAALEDILDGTDPIVLNVASQITQFTDGTYTYSVPTNNPGTASLMIGTAGSTTIWMYHNTAPPGWKVTATGADTVLGVKATAKVSGTADADTANHLKDTGVDFAAAGVVVGDTAYNTTDGTSALVTNVAVGDLTLASDAFPDGNEDYEVGTRFVDPGGTAADAGSWNLCGQTEITAANESSHTHGAGTIAGTVPYSGWSYSSTSTAGLLLIHDGGGSAITASAGQSTTSPTGTSDPGSAHTHTISSNSKWRPSASIGRLFQLDTA